MKLYGMTLTYNESKMIPYVMPYYERLGYDKLVVYDNESTDNTVELLKQYPFVEVKTFKTEGLNDDVNSQLKSDFLNHIKDRTDTWVTISDFDEVLFYDGDFKEYLEEKQKEGYTYLFQPMVQILSEKFDDIDMSNYPKTSFGLGNIWQDGGHKLTLFKADWINSIRYSAGAHVAQVVENYPGRSLNGLDIKSFHVKFLDKEFCFNKMNIGAKRRSETNRRRGYGFHYDIYKHRDKFDNMWKGLFDNSIYVEDYISGKLKLKDNKSRVILILK